MWTGRQTLTSIESTLAKLHSEESTLDRSLRSAVSDAERLRNERSESLRELARIKLDDITAGRLTNSLDAGERRAVALLDNYRKRVADATERRERLLTEVTSVETERDAAAEIVAAALDEVDRLRALAEANVQTAPEWRDAKAERDGLDAVAVEAEKKAAASEAELGAKKKPYDEDPLFAYLWRRRFATSKYASSGWVRALDRTVADFIGYNNARLNYAALIEIPLRLREHAATKRAAVEPAQTVLSDIERRAMVAVGVEAKEKALAEAREKLAVLDSDAEKKRSQLREADAARDALVAGDNSGYNEALTVIATADSKDELATLYQEARRTPGTADDAVVRRLEEIDAATAKVEAEIANLRKAITDLSRRRIEVEGVRDRFRRTGYDHPQTTFENENAIGDALKNVLEGVVRSGVLWEILRQGHRTRPRQGSPDFGGPSFPFPFPKPDGDWRGPSDGGGGGKRSNDDFSTGGSF